jgi:hypothetical protein
MSQMASIFGRFAVELVAFGVNSRVVADTPVEIPGYSQRLRWLEPGTFINELLEIINT